MCGIFLYCGGVQPVDTLRELFTRSQHRGPDDSQFLVHYPTAHTMVAMGFHRLAINGLQASGNQPFTFHDTFTLCNGEIWNHQRLHEDCCTTNTTGSDCEIVPHYLRYIKDTPSRYHDEDPLEELCKALDGVFGLVVYDRARGELHVARDRIGIRSLYYVHDTDAGCVWVASERKSLPALLRTVRAFPPAHCVTFDLGALHTATPPTPYWSVRSARTPNRFDVPLQVQPLHTFAPYLECCTRLEHALVAAVDKRLMSDRPIGCVLSGGLDSTVITAIACKLHRERNPNAPPLRTYTVGMEGASDFVWARMAANHLGTDHHEFVLSEEAFLDAIPQVVAQIESFDVTTVRASVGNWLVAKHIAQTGKDTVLFCGDVADELLGGYRGFGLAPHADAFDDANVAMLENIHRFDVLRCEKSFAGHGLEARVPFADTDVVELVMSFPAEYKMWGGDRIEKDVLRRAFAEYLPHALVWRRKEAFSDGVSATTRSWFEVIQERLHGAPVASRTHMPPYDAESSHYRELFDGLYGGAECIPYFWKHPFTTERDPSARRLANY